MKKIRYRHGGAPNAMVRHILDTGKSYQAKITRTMYRGARCHKFADGITMVRVR